MRFTLPRRKFADINPSVKSLPGAKETLKKLGQPLFQPRVSPTFKKPGGDIGSGRYPGLSKLRDSLKDKPKTSPGAKARESLGWGGQKFAGNMTTDQFVTLAGGLAEAISPDTPQGRVGGVMSQFGQQSMLRRRGMAETMRGEGVEREKLHTTTLIDIGAKEREREGKIKTAETLAGTQVDTARTLAGTKTTTASTLARTQADAARIKAAAEKREFDIEETRRRKESGAEKGLTTYEKVKIGQDKLEYMQNWEKENRPPLEPDYDSWFDSTNEEDRKKYEKDLATWERKREKVSKGFDTAIFGKSRQGLAGEAGGKSALSELVAATDLGESGGKASIGKPVAETTKPAETGLRGVAAKQSTKKSLNIPRPKLGENPEITKARREAGKQEMIALANKMGVGGKNWKALWDLNKDVAKWLWGSYDNFVGTMIKGQTEARKQLGR